MTRLRGRSRFDVASPAEARQREGGFHVVPLQARHLEIIRLQPAQAVILPMLRDSYLRELVEESYAFTMLDGREVIACAGVIPVWEGRECAWAMLSRCGPARFLRVHRTVVGFLAGRKTRRIEITVDVGHAAARRWARMLGFEEEGVLRAYTPDGRDVYSYGRVCNGCICSTRAARRECGGQHGGRDHEFDQSGENGEFQRARGRSERRHGATAG